MYFKKLKKVSFTLVFTLMVSFLPSYTFADEVDDLNRANNLSNILMISALAIAGAALVFSLIKKS